MKLLRNKAFELLTDLEENGLTTDEARERYCDLIEETCRELQEEFSIYEGGHLRDFIETLEEIRAHCI